MWIYVVAALVTAVWLQRFLTRHDKPKKVPADKKPVALASSFRLPCGLELSNRFGKSPMTEQMADEQNQPSSQLCRLYENWGKGGAGLSVTGNVMIDHRYMEGPGNVVIENEDCLPMLQHWAKKAQLHGTPVFVQLSHAGRQCPRRVCSQPIAPSAVSLSYEQGSLSALWTSIFRSGFASPREATVEEIEDIVNRFVFAAKTCKKAGFAGVQIHSAHGYLLSSFLSPRSNRRSDKYGGSEENRRRLLLDVVRAVRAEVGTEYPIGVKLNSADFQRGGFTEEESLRVILALEREGIDLLEVSGGSYENPKLFDAKAASSMRESTLKREAYFFEFAEKVRKMSKVPIMLSGGFRTVTVMEEAVKSGCVDMVGVGRPFCLMPNLVHDILSGEVSEAVRVTVEVPFRPFTALLQNVWYQQQMKLLAQDEEPDLNISRWWTLLRNYVMLYAWRPFK